jgi:hypothetical protein
MSRSSYNGCRCIEHTFHLMACHFINALKIPPLRTIKSSLHNVRDNVDAADDEGDDEDKDENTRFDVDTSINIKAA